MRSGSNRKRYKPAKARGAARRCGANNMPSPGGRATLLAAVLLLLFGLLAPAHAESTPDPCASSAFKQSASITVSSATTVNLVAVAANKAVYVCGFTITIPGSATSAATAQFEYGTGSSCSSPTVLTGTFGSGDAAVSTTPTQVTYGNGGATIMIAPPGNGVCIVGAGTTVAIAGVLTYVQSTGQSFP